MEFARQLLYCKLYFGGGGAVALWPLQHPLDCTGHVCMPPKSLNCGFADKMSTSNFLQGTMTNGLAIKGRPQQL
jgi:hypothetical protein